MLVWLVLSAASPPVSMSMPPVWLARSARQTRQTRKGTSRAPGSRPFSSVSGAGLPPAGLFGARHHPNPFNPLVNISLTIARPGRLTVKVYDVRGRLVRSLIDEQVDTQASLVWNGRDDHGADAASGV